jgi:hypothetical protein
MGLTLFDAVVKSYQQILPSLKNCLEKGRAHSEAEGRNPDETVGLKLAEDMLPLHFQIISAVHHSRHALESAASGIAGPPNFKLSFDYAGLQSHVQDAIVAVDAAKREEINTLADNPVVFRMGTFELPFTATDYLLSFSLPNFYFHVTTAYDLLRMDGVDLGKMDFLGSMRLQG